MNFKELIAPNFNWFELKGKIMSTEELFKQLAEMSDQERANSDLWRELTFSSKLSFFWQHKKWVLFGAMALIMAAPFAISDFFSKFKSSEVETKTVSQSVALSENTDPLKSDNLKILPVANILYDYGKNKLRATEKYGNQAYKIVAVFHQVQDDKFNGGNGILITILESWNSSFMYAVLPKSQRENLINTDNGTLISINCIGLDVYGTSPLLKKCDLMEKVDTKGVRPDLYLDKLVWDNNELVNPK
jgi:hypothetical protein